MNINNLKCPGCGKPINMHNFGKEPNRCSCDWSVETIIDAKLLKKSRGQVEAAIDILKKGRLSLTVDGMWLDRDSEKIGGFINDAIDKLEKSIKLDF